MSKSRSPYVPVPECELVHEIGFLLFVARFVQVYLTYKNTHPPRTLPYAYPQGFRGVPEGCAFSYGRGTPVPRIMEGLNTDVPLRRIYPFASERLLTGNVCVTGRNIDQHQHGRRAYTPIDMIVCGTSNSGALPQQGYVWCRETFITIGVPPS